MYFRHNMFFIIKPLYTLFWNSFLFLSSAVPLKSNYKPLWRLPWIIHLVPSWILLIFLCVICSATLALQLYHEFVQCWVWVLLNIMSLAWGPGCEVLSKWCTIWSLWQAKGIWIYHGELEPVSLFQLTSTKFGGRKELAVVIYTNLQLSVCSDYY